MKFAILGHARSGTSTLREVLNRHPSLRVLGEPFNDEKEGWGKPYLPYVSSGIEETFDKVMKELDKDCNGFKHLIGQLPPEQTPNLLKHIPKIVWIERKNLLQAAVSKQICTQALIGE